MQRTGRTGFGDLIWTSEEKFILASCFPDFKKASLLLPNRTLTAIKHHARALGLCTPSVGVSWTVTETQILRKIWSWAPKKLLTQELPRHNLKAIRGKAWHLGLKGERTRLRRPQITGVPIMDAIRARAYADGISLKKLDLEIGTKTYFQGGQFRMLPNWSYIARAVHYFGGLLTVDWQDD